MNMTRWLMVAAMGVLGCTWAQADSVPPDDGHYLIDLEAWDADLNFNFMPNQGAPPPDINSCLPVSDTTNCGDASIRIDNGGGSTGEDGNFSFNSGPAGTCGPNAPTLACEILYFDNEGPPITSILIQTILPTSELGPDNDYSCSGGALFQSCGFTITDPPDTPTETLNIYLYNPYSANGIVTATPEPAQWIILVLGFAGIIAVRARKQFANSPSA
jgi:hypothetical protein